MRLALIILFSITALVLSGLAIFLVPPHLQIRSVEPTLPEEAELRAIASTPSGPIGIHYINTSTQQLPDGQLAHTVFLIEWANGNLFMIDAGMDSETALEFGKLPEIALGAEQAVSHGTIASLLGDALARVKAMAFTHLHIDHTQGTIPLCDAGGGKIEVFQTSWQKELHNFNTQEGARIVADSCLERVTLQGEGVLTADAYPGLGIVGLGGHTPGSTLYVVSVDGTLWLMSGDISNSKADLVSNRGKGFLYSYLLVPENTNRTRELRLWLSAMDANDDVKVIVSHDLGDIESSGMPVYQDTNLLPRAR
tara:strand:+ start:16780 stop:17706 length:927 start_codon:yes stop_codon:yes gene_type:complete